VCQLRSLLYSLYLNNTPCICLTPRKLRVKNLWGNKQGKRRCKMVGTGIHSLANLCAPIPRFARTGIAPWQTALKGTADCQAPCSGSKKYMWPVQVCGYPLSNLDSCLWPSAVWLFCSWQSIVYKHRGLPRSTVYIWAQSLASEWNLDSAIFHRESPYLMRHYFLTRDFSDVKLLCGDLFRPQLFPNCLSWHNISWHYNFKHDKFIKQKHLS
jgi:hypothetical protein